MGGISRSLGTRPELDHLQSARAVHPPRVRPATHPVAARPGPRRRPPDRRPARPPAARPPPPPRRRGAAALACGAARDRRHRRRAPVLGVRVGWRPRARPLPRRTPGGRPGATRAGPRRGFGAGRDRRAPSRRHRSQRRRHRRVRHGGDRTQRPRRWAPHHAWQRDVLDEARPEVDVVLAGDTWYEAAWRLASCRGCAGSTSSSAIPAGATCRPTPSRISRATRSGPRPSSRTWTSSSLASTA